MKITTNDKLIAYLALFSGIAISCIAEYYSIMGLIAIYPAATIPIVVMGVVLGFGKISGTLWTKQNWSFAPWFLKAYIIPSIIVLMAITSLGVFGFLSKAHSDQNLVSGDVQSKIAVYDEKIKNAKENIDANRKALKQLDEAVDQTMGRSTTETGADRAVSIRRSQQSERKRLLSEIATEQATISKLNEERAPIAAEVRRVEAEVGPIKYIAHLFYGENPDANILEKSVIWVTLLIVIVLDPLAVILLLASQYSFQRFRDAENPEPEPVVDDTEFQFLADYDDLLDKINAELDAEKLAEGDSPEVPVDVINSNTTVTTHTEDVIVLNIDGGKFEPAVDYKILEEDSGDHGFIETPATKPLEGEEALQLLKDTGIVTEDGKLAPEYGGEEVEIPDVERPGDYLTPPPVEPIHDTDYVRIDGQVYHGRAIPAGYVQNEEQEKSNLWTKTVGTTITQEDYIKTSQEHKK